MDGKRKKRIIVDYVSLSRYFTDVAEEWNILKPWSLSKVFSLDFSLFLSLTFILSTIFLQTYELHEKIDSRVERQEERNIDRGMIYLPGTPWVTLMRASWLKFVYLASTLVINDFFLTKLDILNSHNRLSDVTLVVWRRDLNELKTSISKLLPAPA